MVLSVFVKYWCILLYHKCKVEYIEFEVMIWSDESSIN